MAVKTHYRRYVNFKTIPDINKFVESIHSISSYVDACYGRQVVDAKSLLGVISLSNHSLEIVLHSDDAEEIKKFNDICDQYDDTSINVTTTTEE